jgi:glycosyltransferase involved in cell wall biosynthesis
MKAENCNKSDQYFGPKIKKQYCLFTNILLYRKNDKEFFIDNLWKKDLLLHLEYISRFTLVCPVSEDNAPDHYHVLKVNTVDLSIKIVPLPSSKSFLNALLCIPQTFAKILDAFRENEIIHAGVAGWPIPYGWFVSFIKRILFKDNILLILVESAPWRIACSGKNSVKQRIKSIIWEKMACWSVNAADLAIFTHKQYRDSLLSPMTGKGHIIPASWVDEENILTNEMADVIWNEKLFSYGKTELKILFVGRVVREKGVDLLIQAVGELPDGVGLTLDILGSRDMGDLLIDCFLTEKKKINTIGTIPYGIEYFKLLQKYHALVVPTISDEQPRVIFDAFSQALPVIASDTSGNVECITEGFNGFLFESGSVKKLKNLLAELSYKPEKLREIGMAGLDTAKSSTHRNMHLKRKHLLQTII